MFDGMFNNEGTASSGGSGGMICMVDVIVGQSELAFVREVRLCDEYDVDVTQVKECFQFLSVLV
jgi:hypothetical protein